MDISVHTVVPDADVAADWYARAFGARELNRIPLPGGRVMSVLLAFGDSHVHVGNEFREAGILSALSIGGTVVRELADQFWGERHGQLADPFGHRWNIAQHLRDVPPEEVAAAAAAAFSERDDNP